MTKLCVIFKKEKESFNLHLSLIDFFPHSYRGVPWIGFTKQHMHISPFLPTKFSQTTDADIYFWTIFTFIFLKKISTVSDIINFVFCCSCCPVDGLLLLTWVIYNIQVLNLELALYAKTPLSTFVNLTVLHFLLSSFFPMELFPSKWRRGAIVTGTIVTVEVRKIFELALFFSFYLCVGEVLRSF